jgi:hypothetical protein
MRPRSLVIILALSLAFSSCATAPKGSVDGYSVVTIPRGAALSLGSVTLAVDTAGAKDREAVLPGLLESSLRSVGLKPSTSEAPWRVDLSIRSQAYLYDLSSYTSVCCRLTVIEVSSGRIAGMAEIVEDTKYPLESISYVRDLVGRTARALAATTFAKK